MIIVDPAYYTYLQDHKNARSKFSPVMLGLGLGLKPQNVGLGLGLALRPQNVGLGLEGCGLGLGRGLGVVALALALGVLALLTSLVITSPFM